MIRIDPVKSATVAPEYLRLLRLFLMGKQRKSKIQKILGRVSGCKQKLRYVEKGIISSDFVALGNPIIIKKDYTSKFGKSVNATFMLLMRKFYNSFFSTAIKDIDPNHPNKELKVRTWLAKELEVTTCPYCNREYVFSRKLENGRETHPEFDHFYPKSKYPFLALSFYNLVPSCHTCNHLKLEKELEMNPHFSSFEDKGSRFVIKRKGLNENYDPKEDCWMFDPNHAEVKITNPCNNVDELGLEEQYNMHTDVIADIITKAQAYNLTYYESLIESYKGLGKTPEDIYRFIWGGYYNPTDFGKRPLSKFTKDILNEIGID